MACGKDKDSSVKPQNVVGIFKQTQCLFFRQTVHASLRMGHFSSDDTLAHRVIHRSWGIAYESHLYSKLIRVRGRHAIYQLLEQCFEMRDRRRFEVFGTSNLACHRLAYG